MTKNRRHKAAIRAKQQQTGRSYTDASRSMPTFQDVLAAQPELTYNGFGPYRDRDKTPVEREQKFRDDRAELAASEERVLAVCDWLLANITPIKTPSDHAGSYGMKHVAERALGDYVSNGELIAAALMAGYPMGRPYRLNVNFAMSKRDIDRMRTEGWAQRRPGVAHRT